MGDILIAKCKCGFKEQFHAGGGKANFKTFCGAPAYCKKCNAFRVGNYLNPDKTCDTCGSEIMFYNNIGLQKQGKKPKGNAFGWNMSQGNFLLPKTQYFCAKCGKFKLEFKSIGNFD
jgi:hypothetical protein